MSEEIVKSYYDGQAEREYRRLMTAYSRVEFETTMYLIKKYFVEKGKILDIGSGPGQYSLALLEEGNQVTLLDLSQKELDLAKQKIEAKGLVADGYHCQSATDLCGFEANTFDGILVMGPMYHLHADEAREQVLSEVKRVLKPGGRAIVAYINLWGVMKASLYEFPTGVEDDRELYTKPALKLSQEMCFTEAYFVTPPVAISELEKANFEIVTRAGAESFISGMFLEMDQLQRCLPDQYKMYKELACTWCEAPQYRDATEHLHVIIQKNA